MKALDTAAWQKSASLSENMTNDGNMRELSRLEVTYFQGLGRTASTCRRGSSRPRASYAP